jgi:HK97 family phage prohead protease
MKLNSKGVSKANTLVATGKVDKGPWSFSGADGDAILGTGQDWPAYGEWFLGVDPSADPKSKAHYGYPFGKGGKVYRAALIAIEGRATQQGASDISDAAKRLLAKIDAKSATEGFETKTFEFKMTEHKDTSETGTFSGYASVFGNVDEGGDVVERGAFKDMALTSDGQVRVLYQHNMRQPIGKARVSQDDHGLKFDGHLILGISTARDAYEAMKGGILDGMSIGYDVKGAVRNEATGVRHLKDLKLWEISPVTFGMNQLAGIDNVKSSRIRDMRTKRDFEDYLRDEGFSANMAKSIAMTGWRETPDSQLRDAGEAVREVTERLKAFDLKGIDPREAATTISSITEALRQM